MSIETDESPENELQPLLPPSPNSTNVFHRRATGLLSFCTEGTCIYILILISQCFIAASDPPFKASLTRLYKDFLCCQQDPSGCQDRKWCKGEPDNSSERELSNLYRSQAIFNSVGGTLFAPGFGQGALTGMTALTTCSRCYLHLRLVLAHLAVASKETIARSEGYDRPAPPWPIWCSGCRGCEHTRCVRSPEERRLFRTVQELGYLCAFGLLFYWWWLSHVLGIPGENYCRGCFSNINGREEWLGSRLTGSTPRRARNWRRP